MREGAIISPKLTIRPFVSAMTWARGFILVMSHVGFLGISGVEDGFSSLCHSFSGAAAPASIFIATGTGMGL